MEASLQDRLAVASALILQSPPGEVNDVFTDLRPIVGDDGELERGLMPALAQYNTEQLTLVELPNRKIPAMICPAARLDQSSDENRFLDPHSQQTFVFDHLRLAASDLAPYTPPDAEQEKFRSELDLQAESYVKNHYQNAVWSVFSIPFHHPSSPDHRQSNHQPVSSSDNPASALEPPPVDHDHLVQDPVKPEPPLDPPSQPSPNPIDQSDNETQHACSSSSYKFKLYIVGNKYNPTNYWTGRWRSLYEIDMKTGKVQGEIEVNVHYYEQGNVQLSTTHRPEIEIGTELRGPKDIIHAIQAAESHYQTGLNAAYAELGDHTFKLLRRALPVTKQKVNWNNLKSRIVLDDH